MYPGMGSRVRESVVASLESDKYANLRKLEPVVLDQIFPSETAAWVGASIVGGLKFATGVDVQKEDYERDGYVPDWARVSERDSDTSPAA